MSRTAILAGFALLALSTQAQADPAPFSLVSPSHTSQDVNVWPQFEWEASTDTCAVTYELHISTDPEFDPAQTEVYADFDVVVYRPGVDLLMGEVLYFWKVKAVNEFGAERWADTPTSPFDFWTLQTIPASEPREINGYEPLPFDRTLITENSPYILHQGDLTIPEGITLAVLEGVTLQIEGDREIDIHGCLKMLGSAAFPIEVTTTNDPPSPGDWEHVTFTSTATPAQFDEAGEYEAGPILQHVNFRFAGSGEPIVTAPYTAVYIDHCAFEDCSNSIGLQVGGIDSRLSNNALAGFYEYAIKVTGDSTKVIGNLVEDCHRAGVHVHADAVVIQSNTISDCELMDWGYIDNEGVGLHVIGDDVLVIGNVITNCGAIDFTGYNGYWIGGAAYIRGLRGVVKENTISACYLRVMDTIGFGCTLQGGGLCMDVSHSVIENNDILGNHCLAKSRDDCYGGGVSLSGDGNTFRQNRLEGNYIESEWHPGGKLEGGGLWLHGNDNVVDDCRVVGNFIMPDPDADYDGILGAGIYASGSRLRVSNCEIADNIVIESSTYHSQAHGGGLYVDVSEFARIDSCTVASNSAYRGGGIYDAESLARIEHCTITGNYAEQAGGGVYECHAVLNSIIKHNEVGDPSYAGGIEADADSVCFNNISHNQGYQLKQLGSDETVATNNWWFTRSDQIVIEEGIYDGHDTGGSLGLCTYQPFLNDPSVTTPSPFEVVTAVTAMDDSTYTAPLSHPIAVGDTLYFQIEGVDSNPYNRDVTVASAINWDNYHSIRPFFQETADTSGVFECRIFVDNETIFPDMIRASSGDSLVVASEVDPDYWFHIIVGGAPAPTYTVHPDGSGDFPTIQAAMDAAEDQDTIELTAGVFSGEGNRDLDFAGKAITLRAQGGAEGLAVIDCEGTSAEPHRALWFHSGEGPTSRVEGLTFRNGYAPDAGGGHLGGAVLCEVGSEPQIRHCTFVDGWAEKGAGLACLDAQPILEGCTFVYNEAPEGGVVYTNAGAGLEAVNCIVAFSYEGVAFACEPGGEPVLACCDVYGNAGGDYVGCIEDWAGVNGNISWDPLFCEPEAGNFTLDEESPCAPHSPPNEECALIGAWEVGCSTPEPPFALTAVTDIPNDQGRQVCVRWNRHAHDQAGTDTTITAYSLWRRVDLRTPPGEWEFVVQVPAGGQEEYITVAPTLCDSTEAGLCWSAFFVRAHTQDPVAFYETPADSGYSIDNLAPSAPENLDYDEQGDLLTWDPVAAEDFDYYSVYGSAADSLDPSAQVLGHTVETTWDLGSVSYAYYHVTATDFAGNEGQAASVEGDASSAINHDSSLPRTFALMANRPNPVLGTTRITFDLPVESDVHLAVYDLTGRMVRVLRQGAVGAGRHPVVWDGRDDQGAVAVAGVYFYRLEAGAFQQTRKLIITR